MKIAVNPEAWQNDAVVVGATTYRQGETYDVDDAAWEKLSQLTVETARGPLPAFVRTAPKKQTK